MARIQGVVPATVDWMVQHLVSQAQRAYARAHPSDRKRKPSAARRRSASGTITRIQEDAEADPPAVVVGHHHASDEARDHRISYMQRSHSLPDHYSSQDDGDGDEHDTEEALDSGSDDEMVDVDELADAGASLPHAPLVFSPAAASASRQQRREPAAYSDITPSAWNETMIDDGVDDIAHGKGRPRSQLVSEEDSPSLKLGRLGAEDGGLYIILFADDIHSTHELLVALKDFFWAGGSIGLGLMANVLSIDTLLTKLVRALRQHGYLVVSAVTLVGSSIPANSSFSTLRYPFQHSN